MMERKKKKKKKETKKGSGLRIKDAKNSRTLVYQGVWVTRYKRQDTTVCCSVASAQTRIQKRISLIAKLGKCYSTVSFILLSVLPVAIPLFSTGLRLVLYLVGRLWRLFVSQTFHT